MQQGYKKPILHDLQKQEFVASHTSDRQAVFKTYFSRWSRKTPARFSISNLKKLRLLPYTCENRKRKMIENVASHSKKNKYFRKNVGFQRLPATQN